MELHFLGRNAGFEEAKACLLPVPYEGTVCFGKGAAKGPEGIMFGSREVELYDMELGRCIIGGDFPNGFHVSGPLNIEGKDSKAVTADVEAWASGMLDSGKLPIVLGGEHSVSIGAVRAAAKRFPGLCILHIDAHADLRDEYQGNTYSHACAMRRIIESEGVGKYAQVGIRSMSAECAECAKEQAAKGRGRVFGGEFDVAQVLEALGDAEHIYITIDLDGFDPSEVPGVGTPQPGGISWFGGLELLREVARKKKIVGFDIVELAPIMEQAKSEMFAATLLYRLVGYALFPESIPKENPCAPRF
ncbi:agmatinase [Candidatus Micrarchaeota archaeon]|nr:agmatinase [Candidatus Micrarchaeota archaeon]